MRTQEAIEILNQLEKTSFAYNSALGCLSFDGATVAPKQSWRGRGEAVAFLAGELYRQTVTGENQEAIATILQDRENCPLKVVRQAEEYHDQLEEMLLTPAEEFAAHQGLLAEADAAWHEAKETSNYALFAPLLEQLIAYDRRFAQRKDADKPAYDVLLDRFEKGASMAMLEPFFQLLQGELTPLIQQVKDSPQPDTSFLHQDYPVARQREFSDRVMALMGIDRERCAIAETEHPFTDGNSRWDVRITTHYQAKDVASSLYSVVHEGGHALYELGVAEDLQFTCLGTGSSMGIHESQSRFYENLIGRSLPFVEALMPLLRDCFPEQTRGVTAEAFWRAVNRAEPSLIRTEADELTYPLHILVRYEMEKRMIAGDVTVQELPALWNELYRKYLGIDVPDDRSGILQDSHWSGGAFGYFPSYALGSAYGVQMLDAMVETVDVWGSVAKGDLTPVTRWLGERIHQYGRLKTPAQLLVSAGVKPFNPQRYVDYLKDKFTGLYRL